MQSQMQDMLADTIVLEVRTCNIVSFMLYATAKMEWYYKYA